MYAKYKEISAIIGVCKGYIEGQGNKLDLESSQGVSSQINRWEGHSK